MGKADRCVNSESRLVRQKWMLAGWHGCGRGLVDRLVVLVVFEVLSGPISWASTREDIFGLLHVRVRDD